MTRTIRRLAATAALLIAGIPGMAAAQFQVVGYGSGEWDTHNTAVYVLGIAGQTTNLGLGPALNVLFYDVQLPNNQSIRAINPQAGIQYRWNQSSLQGRVGYVFVRGDTLTASATNTTAFGGSRSGLSTTGQYEYWGDGTRSLEVIGNMNWGDKYWWTTANAGFQVAKMSNGGLALGAEVVGQGNSDSQVFQIGPRAELAMGPVKINGVVGYKIRNDIYDNGPYFKVGFVIIP
jgi:hypothetical protein